MHVMEILGAPHAGTESRLAAVAMHIRAHLDERLTLESIAGIAGFSPFHFHRVFRVAFGETLADYVGRHRLQRAAHDLRSTRDAITEIGLSCGYESPSAFGRAFARVFGVTPSVYRAHPGALSISPRHEPLAAAIGEPRIVDLAARDGLGLDHVGTYVTVDAIVMRVHAIARKRGFLPAATLAGLSFDSPDIADHETLRFTACVTLVPGADRSGARADGLREGQIPGGRYAIYRHVGPYERITHAFDRMIACWILTGRLALRDGPFVCFYVSDPAVTRAAQLESDLAIPVR